MSGKNPLLASMSEIDKEIFTLWAESDPSTAYASGLEEYAGKIFVPTENRVEAVRTKIKTMLRKAKEKNQRKLLQCIDMTLEFQEPYRIIITARDTFFAHIVKDEGINPQHLLPLLEETKKSLSASKEELAGKTWPAEVKVITCQSCDELRGVLTTVREEARDQSLKDKVKEILDVLADYRKTFHVEGVVEGDFTEVFPILERSGGNIGHKKIYPKLLKRMYDYYETPKQIEDKGLRQLGKELPLFKNAVERLARVYGCEPKFEEVTRVMIKRSAIPKDKIIEYVSNIRKKLLPLLGKLLVRITPKYNTRLIETPPYLVNFIPTAATNFFNMLTDKPLAVFFLTTDEKRSPPSGAADMIQTIVHEETGHCVHYQNSCTGFGAKPAPVELMNSNLSYPTSDAISFHREYEFLTLLKKLAGKDKDSLTEDEKEFLDVIRGERDLEEVALENELILMQWRLVRFLRAIFDSRINMGKQTVTDFVKWASRITGLQEKLIFNQTYFFLQQVGYAPVYFIVGDALRQIQEKAVKRGVDLVDFNTYATSLGYGARTLWEEKLKNYGKQKRD